MAYNNETYMDENQRRIPSIYMCIHCGSEIGKVKRVYCNECQTAASRAAVELEHLAIQNELAEKQAAGVLPW